MADLESPPSHPSLEVLATYRRGDLSEATVEEVQDHLADCSQCCDTMLDLADLANPDPPSEPSRWQPEKVASWEALRESLFKDQPVGEVRSFVRPDSQPATPKQGFSHFAAAAMVVFSLGLGALVASQFVGPPSGGVELAKAKQEAERAHQELEGANSRVAELEGELERFRSPWLNVEDFNLFPRGFVRGGPDSEEVVVSTSPGLFTLTLNLLEAGDESHYRLRVLNQSGEEIWMGEGLARTKAGTLSLALPHDFFPPGSYRLELEEPEEGSWRSVAEYELEVR